MLEAFVHVSDPYVSHMHNQSAVSAKSLLPTLASYWSRSGWWA